MVSLPFLLGLWLALYQDFELDSKIKKRNEEFFFSQGFEQQPRLSQTQRTLVEQAMENLDITKIDNIFAKPNYIYCEVTHTSYTGRGNVRIRTIPCLIYMDDIERPRATIRKKDILDMASEKLGFTKITVDHDTTFDEKFVLDGANEDAVKPYFTPTRTQALVNCNISGEKIMLARNGIVIRAAEFIFVQDLKPIYEKMVRILDACK